jgi:hypothetical protein
VKPVGRRLLVLALLALVSTAGCLGDIRTTNTKRTAVEELLVSTAAERAIAKVDSSVFAGKRVFVDVERLAPFDKGYVVSAFQGYLAQGGASVVPARDKAQVVVEVRSGSSGIFDGKWGVGIPMVYASGFVAGSGGPTLPNLIEITYELREGWAKISGFAYDAKQGTYLAGWRDAYGMAYVGFFDDIFPSSGIGDTLTSYTK